MPPTTAFVVELADRLVEHLYWRTTCDPPLGPITAANLASGILRTSGHIDKFRVCEAVHLLRKQGHPIASTPKGYSYATDPKQLEPSIQELLRKVTGIHESIHQLRKTQRRMEEARSADILPFAPQVREAKP